MNENYELYHFGIKGQKWGVRRYQDKNGRLTNAGKKRYESSRQTKTWDKEPEGYSTKQQGKELRAKQAYDSAKGYSARKKAKAEYEAVCKESRSKIEEYRQFQKAMYKKVGYTGDLTKTKDENGKVIYKNKHGQTFKEFEVSGARSYEQHKKIMDMIKKGQANARNLDLISEQPIIKGPTKKQSKTETRIFKEMGEYERKTGKDFVSKFLENYDDIEMWDMYSPEELNIWD